MNQNINSQSQGIGNSTATTGVGVGNSAKRIGLWIVCPWAYNEWHHSNVA